MSEDKPKRRPTPTVVREAMANYREWVKVMGKADRLLLELITHPDSTDEQILQCAHERRTSTQSMRKAREQIIRAGYEAGLTMETNLFIENTRRKT